MPKVFEIFLHVKNAVETTGVGLPLVKKTIEEHCGEITLESEKGDNATFHFT